jgi:hypothetical protein
LAMGNSSWMGPPMSSLLFIMKREDVGQGRPSRYPLDKLSWLHWSGGALPVPESPTAKRKVFFLCPEQCPFIYSRNLPGSVLEEYQLVSLMSPTLAVLSHLHPKNPFALSSTQCPKT